MLGYACVCVGFMRVSVAVRRFMCVFVYVCAGLWFVWFMFVVVGVRSGSCACWVVCVLVYVCVCLCVFLVYVFVLDLFVHWV